MTKLLYLTDSTLLSTKANVVSFNDVEGTLVLDQTIFYAQGGGQPSDRGMITGVNGSLVVEMVKVNDQIVAVHTGSITGSFTPGEEVQLEVDPTWRAQMTRLHSAGHILRFAMLDCGYNWKPTRGFHFPEGTYIESEPEHIQEVTDEAVKKIEQAANAFVAQDYKTEIHWDGDVRTVVFGPHNMPCGGTHILKGSDIKDIRITKVKKKSGRVRFSYSVN